MLWILGILKVKLLRLMHGTEDTFVIHFYVWKKKRKSREKALEKRFSSPQQKYLSSWSLVRCNEEKRTISLNLCFLKFQLGLVLQTFSVHGFAVGWVSSQKLLWDGCIVSENEEKKMGSKKRSNNSFLCFWAKTWNLRVKLQWLIRCAFAMPMNVCPYCTEL